MHTPRYAFLNVPPGSLKGQLEEGEGELQVMAMACSSMHLVHAYTWASG